MANRDPRSAGLWAEVREDYRNHIKHTFMRHEADASRFEQWRTAGQQNAKVFLGTAFLPITLFRVRNRLLRLNVPLLPYFCEMISAAIWGVNVGRFVEAGPGLLIPHGHVVIDGIVTLGRDCAINPWATIGLTTSRRVGFSRQGPRIGDGVYIGTGARILGPVTIGDGARIGANAVVIDDVPAGATAVGVPARVVQNAPPGWDQLRESDSS